MAETIYRKPDRKKVFLQGEEPWGSKPYAPGSTVYKGGCGLCAVAHMAIDRDYYADYDPLDLIDFMKQYTRKGKGTMWYGITEGMKHIGLEDIKTFDGDMVGGTMKGFYEELKKGDRIGCILFQNPLRDVTNEKDIPKGVKYKVVKNADGTKKFVQQAADGTIWTYGGHYVSIHGIKKVNGYYWLYCKDSGGSHTGWFNYSRSMKGLIRMLWVGQVPEDPINLPTKGYFEKGDSSPEVIKIQKFLKKHKLYNGACKGNVKILTDKGIRAYEKKFNLKVDGKFGGACLRQYVKMEVKK